MQSVYELVFTSVLFGVVIFGMILNGFIVLMNGKTWIRNKCLPNGDKIITSLCLSRWMFQCLSVVNMTLQLCLQRIHLDFANLLFYTLRILMNYISIWLASLLCVYYCVKITSYKHAVFLYLKENMSRLVPWCLGFCVLSSLAFSMPLTWLYFLPEYEALTTEIFQNMTKKTTDRQYSIGSTPPLLIFGLAFFLTVPSLWRHIRNMSGVGTSFRNPDMKTHYNAIKSMVAFFLLHFFFIVAGNATFAGVRESESPYKSLLFIASALYPCLHSGVIIYYNRKLRELVLFPMTHILSIFQEVTDSRALGFNKLIRRLHARNNILKIVDM